MPGTADVLGLGVPATAVSVNGNTASRKGEYFHYALPTPNSGSAQYTTVTVVSGAESSSGKVFVPQNPEVFAHDLDGNLTSDGRWNYTWDAENRLIKMESFASAPAGSKRRLEFAIGRRIWKRLTNLDTSAVTEERFLYDGWNLVAVLSPSSATILKSFVWGTDLSGSSQGAGGVGGLLKINDSTLGSHFCAYDGNGNLTALVKATDGSLAAQYEYAPFGEVIRSTGPMAKANPFRFSTKYQDDETDLLYYCPGRYYHASTGVWLSRDRMEESAAANLYEFVGDDPVNKIDVRGFRTWVPYPYPGHWVDDPEPPPPPDPNVDRDGYRYKPFPPYNPPDLNKPCCCMDHSTITARRTDTPPTWSWTTVVYTRWILHFSVDVKVTGNCIKDVEIQWQRCYNQKEGGNMGSGPSVDVTADTILGIGNKWVTNARVFYLKCEYGYWRLGRTALNKSGDAPMGYIWTGTGWEH